MPGNAPSTIKLSLWQTPQASIFTRTSPRPGSGTSRSTSCSGPFFSATCTARIFIGLCRYAGSIQLNSANPPSTATVVPVT